MNAFVAVFLPLMLAYGTAFLWCIDRWNAPTEYFAHCWLVPIVAVAVVYARRSQWRTAAAAPDRRGLWLLVPALLLHLFGLDHTKLAYHYNGQEQKLTDTNPARVVKELLA